MQLEYFALSDVGKKREKNEDSVLADGHAQLFLVADGMGGHLGGEYASRMAVNTIGAIIETLENDPNATLSTDTGVKPGDYKSLLNYAIQVASNKVYEKASADPALHGMGTTTVGLLFRGNRVYIANVGDSRGYRIRGGKIEQVTEDHSLVGEQLRAGMLEPEEVREHRLKNIITRSVGFQGEVEVDVVARVVKPGDIYLLCSDGLSNMVPDAQLCDVVAHNKPKEACRRLIDIANERGGDDNISAVLVKVLSTESNDEEETTIQL